MFLGTADFNVFRWRLVSSQLEHAALACAAARVRVGFGLWLELVLMLGFVFDSVRVRGCVRVGFGLGLEFVLMLGLVFGFGVGFGHVLGAVARSGRRTEETLSFAWGYTQKNPLPQAERFSSWAFESYNDSNGV